MRDPGLAEDLFQEVPIVILRRWEEFGEVRDFWALARETARRQALAALRGGRDAEAQEFGAGRGRRAGGGAAPPCGTARNKPNWLISWGGSL